MIKNITKCVLFICLFITLFVGYFRVFNFKRSDGIYQMMKFYDEAPNSLDVIFLGSSHMFVNANTSVLWDEYGIASYDLGGSVQPYWNTYHYLVEAFKYQNPKVVVFDVFTAADVDEEYFSYENVIKNTYGLRFSANKIDAIKASVKEGDRDCYYYEYPTFHRRYLEDIDKKDFIFDFDDDYYMQNCWKGETLMYGANSMPRPEDSVIYNDTIGTLTEKNEKYLRKIIDLCKEKETPLVLVLNPYYVLEYQMPFFNRVKAIAEETGTEYVNFNLMYDEIGVDFDNDFIDACHMKYSGSAKFTRFLAENVLSDYEIIDKRGNKEYKSYDEMVDMYKKVTSYYDIGEETKFSKVMDKLNPEDAIIICTAQGNYQIDPDYEDYMRGLQIAGIDITENPGNSAWVIDNGNVIFNSGNASNYSWRSRVSKYDTISVNSKEKMYDGDLPCVVPEVKVNSSMHLKADDGVQLMVYDKKLNSVMLDMSFSGIKEEE